MEPDSTGLFEELLLLSRRDQALAKAAGLRAAVRRGEWDLAEAMAEDLMRVDPGQLLRVLLDPARDPGAPSPARLDAYRLLLRACEGSLADRELALLLHREWIELSFGAPTRRARRRWRAQAAGLL